MLPKILLSCLLLCLAQPALATDWEQLGASGTPVKLEADELNFDQQTGRYRASGNVELQQGAMELRSRILWWNQTSGEVQAEGGVVLTAPDEKLTGSKARFNLQQGTGSVEDGYIYLREPNLHVHGKHIERHGDYDYRIIDGTFTTCDGEVPSWKFGASQLDITVDGYARAKNAVFYLKDIPSFYVPYMVYPAKTDRESGFLTPHVGYSEKRGAQFSGAYYLVMARNQDATFYFDLLSEMGIGKGVEYRYVFDRQKPGRARLYHIDVDRVDGVDIDEERFAVEWQHDGLLPGDVRLLADVEYVNDDQFFEDFGNVAEEYNKDKVQSILALSRHWQKLNLVGQFKYTKDLETADDDTLQLLPRINFDVARQRFSETPFSYRLETEYTNFWRERGARGERLVLRPQLGADILLWNRLEVSSALAYRERLYWGLNEDLDGEEEGQVEVSARVGTRLERVYEQPIGPLSKVRHTLEPEVVYRYTPENDQSHLPNFDSDDRISAANRVEYALVQRLTGRFDNADGPPTYRQLAYVRLSQSYRLDEPEPENFSAVRAEVTLLPSGWSRFDGDFSYSLDQGEWQRISTEVALHDQLGNALRVEYRYEQEQEIDYAALQLETAFLKPFYVNYAKRYDVNANERLEDRVGVEYRQQCWSALLSYWEHENDRAVMLTFNLKGIGAVGGVGGDIGDF